MAISPDGSHNQPIGLLTSDVALKTDPDYFRIVEEFSGNLTGFDSEFGRAWYKLTTRDMDPGPGVSMPTPPSPRTGSTPCPGSTSLSPRQTSAR